MGRRAQPFTVSLLIMGCLVLPAAVHARDDWELWAELRWKKPLSERLSLQGVSSLRLRGGMGELYRHFEEAGLGYKWLPWLKVEGAYHWNASDRPNTHDQAYEHRLYVALTPQVMVAGLQLENRHRLEFRHINGFDDWRYRSRVKASLPLGTATWWHMKPFVADELFYGFRAGEVNRNRTLIGVERTVTKQLAVELFYVLESNKAGRDWDEFHGVGLATSVTF